jgi:hypothetical protein
MGVQPSSDSTQKIEEAKRPVFEKSIQTTSIRGREWVEFAARVAAHIDNYTVPQYGDKGEDQCTEYSVTDHVTQAKKYANRFGRNQRGNQEPLDMMKGAHYFQMAFTELLAQQTVATPGSTT